MYDIEYVYWEFQDEVQDRAINRELAVYIKALRMDKIT